MSYTINIWGWIFGKVKSNYWSITHKHGLQVPEYIMEAKKLDRDNNNTFWMDSIQIKTKEIMVAFK